MTQNQIAYWTLQETKRSNQIREGETERSNKAKEYETNRANVRKEELQADIQEAQKSRIRNQNGVDIANAVTRGIADVTKGAKNVSDIIGDWVKPGNLAGGSSDDWDFSEELRKANEERKAEQNKQQN